VAYEYIYEHGSFKADIEAFFAGKDEPKAKASVTMDRRDYAIRAAKTCVELGSEHPEVQKVIAKLAWRTGELSNAVWYRINMG
jgi:hypothetical protein